MSDEKTIEIMTAAPEGAVFLTNDLDRAHKIASIYMRSDLKITMPDMVVWTASIIKDVPFPIIPDDGVSFDEYSPGTVEEVNSLNAGFGLPALDAPTLGDLGFGQEP